MIWTYRMDEDNVDPDQMASDPADLDLHFFSI